MSDPLERPKTHQGQKRQDLFREHAIAVLGETLITAANQATILPPEAFTEYTKLINSMQVDQNLADVITAQFEDFNARLSHLETGKQIENAQAQRP